ncbi:hypothetical protein BOTBODRAFT_56522 [Botryobasidium botryosum FD-172 SS1]|uniref:Response regulatory domain-containing protein n=1 Tax=Botryobasidium botryosum (strain FD-172 SS1) TaxID=930990 RepID=A0A067MAC1_BOTB1|nr:hypothetical protein BOTBODRAFT_56522 [Botryobasidium botryosum FD-172 SS1]
MDGVHPLDFARDAASTPTSDVPSSHSDDLSGHEEVSLDRPPWSPEAISPIFQPSFQSKFGLAIASGSDARPQPVLISPQNQVEHIASFVSGTEVPPLTESLPPLSPERTRSGSSAQNTISPSASAHPSLPHLSRAFSMPAPSQLGHLRRPVPPVRGVTSPRAAFQPEPDFSTSDFYLSLSLELADFSQTVIQTLIQLTPPHMLDPAKEQFSACTLQLPTPSVASIFTALKCLNYMSANLDVLAGKIKRRTMGVGLDSPALSSDAGTFSDLGSDLFMPVDDAFDIGELLQSVGDVLGGLAGVAGVDLVLYHADMSLKHISVRADECGIMCALTHVLRQIIAVCGRGDAVEVGLHIADSIDLKALSDDNGIQATPLPSPDAPLMCYFEITRRIFREATEGTQSPPLVDRRPCLDGEILTRLLRHVNATLTDMDPSPERPDGSYNFAIQLTTGPPLPSTPLPLNPEDEAMRQPFSPAMVLAREPTLEELTIFAETTLRGKKAIVHLSENSSFAHYLSSYLTGWGVDMSPLPIDPSSLDCRASSTEGKTTASVTSTSPSTTGLPTPTAESGLRMEPFWGTEVPPISGSTSVTGGYTMAPFAGSALLRDSSNSTTASQLTFPGDSSFIIIDDCVDLLRRRLVQSQREAAASFVLHPKQKRPSLAAHHRPKSTQHVWQTHGGEAPLAQRSLSSPPTPSQAPTPVNSGVIIHFTSLANYKAVKDVIQSFLFASPSNPPEVLVVPKPAAPRRLLTALYTAVNKPVVDTLFAPIATAPVTPVSQTGTFTLLKGSRREGRTPPLGSRNTTPSSERPSMHVNANGEFHGSIHLPSPLSNEALSYFSESAAKIHEGTVASGMVLQSPDGRPAGIFFQPPSKGSRSDAISSHPLSRTRRKTLTSLSSMRSETRLSTDGSYSGASDGPSSVGSTNSPRIRLNTSGQASQSKTSPGLSSRNQGKGKGIVADDLIVALGSPGVLPSPGGYDDMPMSPPEIAAGSMDSAFSDIPSTPSIRHAVLKDSASIRSAGPPPISTSPISESPLLRKKSLASDSKLGLKKKLGSNNDIVPPINVLIVEDNPINQTILATFMKKKKIRYGVAKDGREAVDKWKTGGFHLILMDIQMPIMDGIEATKEIRRLERSSNIGFYPSTPPTDGPRTPPGPVERTLGVPPSSPFRSSVVIVALTASSLESDRHLALAAGCNDFLTKPVSHQWLDKKIIEWGSIKALQMWADPELAKTFASGQDARAKALQLRIVRPSSPARRQSQTADNPATKTTPAINVRAATPQSESMPSSPKLEAVSNPPAPSLPAIPRSSSPVRLRSITRSPLSKVVEVDDTVDDATESPPDDLTLPAAVTSGVVTAGLDAPPLPSPPPLPSTLPDAETSEAVPETAPLLNSRETTTTEGESDVDSSAPDIAEVDPGD